MPGAPRPDGETFRIGARLAPSPNGVVGYLSRPGWKRAVASERHWPATPRPSIFDFREPVDLVYTWVDGEDPAWLERKAQHSGKHARGILNPSAMHESRFVSHDELRYSLRSVAMYANWVRKVFIVTDDQVPPWLDRSNPRIEVIDHAKIFRDPSVLPVYNSHAIESQLHHIDDLAQHYLYLNDDFFFGRPVTPELFFHANGISKFFLSTAVLDLDEPSRGDLPVMSAAKRNRALIEAEFGVTVTRKFRHTPHPQLRDVLEIMEKRHPDAFARVAGARFRHPQDLSIPSALHHYYAYSLARAVPGEIDYLYQDIALATMRRRLDNLARSRGVDVFCLNDHHSDTARLTARRRLMGRFFERYFPVPSEFELH